MQKFDLRRLRKDVNLSQQQLGEILSLPQSSISAMENGKTQITDSLIRTLSEKLGIIESDYLVETGLDISGLRTSTELREALEQERGANVELREKVDSLRAQLESQYRRVETCEDKNGKLYQRIDGYMSQILDLTNEVNRLKILLIKNNIDYKEI